MIAEKERDEVLTTLAITQNENLFQQVLALVRRQEEASAARAKAGFLRGSVVYQEENWDRPLPDEYWNHNVVTTE